MNKKRKIIISAVGLFLLVTSGVFALQGFFGGGDTIPEDTLTRGLAGYWSFNEGGGTIAYDASGNNNNGTLTNGPKWTQGKDSSALQFDGKDDYVDMSERVLLSGEFTIAFWVRRNGTNANYEFAIGSDYGIPGSGACPKIGFTSGDAGFIRIYRGGASSNFGVTIDEDKWYFLVFTRDADNKIDFSYNGGEFSRLFGDVAQAGDSYWSRIGMDEASWKFNGQVDEVRIYDRMLTEAEVKYHYNHGGPVGYWPFDEGSGSVVYDATGNSNDGTISGATWAQGKYGSALSFDGTDDYVDLTPVSSVSITKDFTVTGWFNSNDVSQAQTIIQHGSLASDRLGVKINSNRLFFGIYDGSQYISTKSNDFNLSNSTWYHFAYIHYSNGTAILYLNGRKQSGESSGITLGSTGFRIGARIDSMHFFNGVIDDIKIYNYARIADEIRLDYQAGLATHLGPSSKTCSEDPASCMDYGLVGYWPFDESSGTTAYDASSSENHSTLNNSPKWTKGKNGGALQFDGKDDYVDCGNNSSLNITGNDLTIETWVKLLSTPSANYAGVVRNYISGGGGYMITFLTNRKAVFHLGEPTPAYPTVTSDNSFNIGEWYHIIAVLDSGTMKMYVNSQKQNNELSGQTIYSVAQNLHIGKYTSSLNGQIDEVRIYNRALSAEEVRYHYNHDNPIGYWNMDEGSGSVIKDKTGNSNDGTISGATWAQGKYGSALSFDGVDDYARISMSENPYTLSEQTISGWFNFPTTDTVYGVSYPPANYDGDTGEDYNDGGIMVRRGLVGTHEAGYISTAMNVPAGFNGSFALTLYSKVTDNTQAVNVWTIEVYEDDILKWSYGANADSYTQPDTYIWKESSTWIFDGTKSYTIRLYWPANIDFYARSLSIMCRRGGIGHTSPWRAMIFQGSSSDSMSVGYYTTPSVGSTSAHWFSPAVPRDGAFHHVSVTLADGEKKLYIDGDLKQKYTGCGDLSDAAGDAYIGSPWRDTLGVIDDVKLYNYARTAEQIQRDYQQGLATHLGPSEKTCSEDPASCMDYGLVGYWPFDESSGTTAYDATGNGNNGTLTNGPKWTKGKNGGALQFDGKNDYVTTTNTVQTMGTDNFSVEGWIKFNLISSSGSFNGGGIAGTLTLIPGWQFGIDNGCLYLYTRDSDGVSTSGCYQAISNISLNQWHHLVGIRSGTSLLVYVDGILVASNITTIRNVTNSDNLVIGRPYSGNGTNGQIDGVRIYNRALSAEEVRYHYDQGKPVAHWDFNEGEGDRLFDKSGNNNHGTISGATWIEGKYGSALSFDGVDDYVSIGDKLNMGTSDWSVSGWIKHPTTSATRGIINKRANTLLTNPGYQIQLQSDDKLYVYFSDGSDNRIYFGSNNIFSDDSWHYFTVTFNRDGDATIYRDGFNDGTTSISSQQGDASNSRPLYIGAVENTTTPVSSNNGFIDDIRIYNYTRTAEQIQQDYQQGLATHFK